MVRQRIRCIEYSPNYDMLYQYFTVLFLLIVVAIEIPISFFYSYNNKGAFIFGIVWLLIGGVFMCGDIVCRRGPCMISWYVSLIFYFPATLCIIPNTAYFSIAYEYGIISLSKIPIIVFIIVEGQGCNWLIRHSYNKHVEGISYTLDTLHPKLGFAFILIGPIVYFLFCYLWYYLMRVYILYGLIPKEEFGPYSDYWENFMLVSLLTEQIIYIILLAFRWAYDYSAKYTSLYVVLISHLPIVVASLPFGMLITSFYCYFPKIISLVDNADSEKNECVDVYLWDCCEPKRRKNGKKECYCCDKPQDRKVNITSRDCDDGNCYSVLCPCCTCSPSRCCRRCLLCACTCNNMPPEVLCFCDCCCRCTGCPCYRHRENENLACLDDFYETIYVCLGNNER